MAGSINRIMVQVGLSKRRDPISKITREKRAEGMAQVVRGLPSKCEALRSTAITEKKKRKHEFQENTE
jgi:hypothetical protein